MTKNLKVTNPNHKAFKLIWNIDIYEDNPDYISEYKIDTNGFDGRLVNRGNSLLDKWINNFTIYVEGFDEVDYFLCGAYHSVISDSLKR